MRVCVCVCVCVCVVTIHRKWVYACLPHKDVWINDKWNMFVLCLCAHACMCVVCVFVCVHVCFCERVYVCVHVCACVCNVCECGPPESCE